MRITDNSQEIKQRKELNLTVDGQIITALEGETIAAALVAAGIRTFSHSVKSGKPMGIYCGRGYCGSCMMTVNKIPNIRTCLTLVSDNMEIKTQKGPKPQ